jgi:hypothetical protein
MAVVRVDGTEADCEALEHLMEQIVIEPDWPGMIRYFATGLSTHSFEYGAKSPLGSLMEMVKYLSEKDPEEMEKIIREFRDGSQDQDNRGNGDS